MILRIIILNENEMPGFLGGAGNRLKYYWYRLKKYRNRQQLSEVVFKLE